MPRGDRGDRPKALGWPVAGIGVVLAIALAWGLGWSQAREKYNREQTPAAYAAAAKKDAQRACAGVDPAAVFECVNEKVETAYQTAHDEQDLSAQQRAASSALVAAVIGFVTLIISVVGVWFVKRTLDATLEAVEDTGRATHAMLEANEIARTAQRPWLQIDIVNIDKCQLRRNEAHGDFISVDARVEVENIGKLPATEVVLLPYIWLFSVADPNAPHSWGEAPKRALASALATVTEWENSIGRMIYPAQSETLRSQTSTAAVTLAGSLPVDREYPFWVELNVTCVVLYKISPDDWRHSVSTAVMRIGTLQEWHDAGGTKRANMIPTRVTFMDTAN